MKPLLALLAVLILASDVQAQELNCSVSVNYSQLAGSDYTYLSELREKAVEYLNNRQWTDDRFEEAERIECTMNIIMQEALTLTSFRARIVVASRRPIHSTAQQSTVVQLSDEEWRFDFPQGTPLVWEPDRYHPLTSVLNFYAYTVIGFDYDSFSEYGGTPHFEKARRIAEIAANSGAAGWQALGGDRTRGELVSQILDARYRQLRLAYYEYHLNGLDRFVSDTDRARNHILDTISGLQGLYTDATRAYYLDQFFSTKFSEIAAVFRGSSVASQAFDVLQQIDPAHLSDYTAMMQ